MKLLLIILLQCFTCINSLSFYISNAFNSNAFNSNAFISNTFNSGSFNMNSNTFNSGIRSIMTKHCNSFLSYSTSPSLPLIPSPTASPSPKNNYLSYSNNQPTYLSYVVSNVLILSSYKSLYLISSLPLSTSPSPKPSLSPSPSPSIKPSLPLMPRPSIKPSPSPSISPSLPLMPSPSLIPIISFDTKIAFSNFNSVDLDIDSQTAIIVATADAMDISASFIKYIGTVVQSRRRLINQVFNVIVSLQTTIPLQGQYASFQSNPSALYLSLTTSLENSVDSGAFVKALPPSFANSTVLSVENGKYVVIEPATAIQKTIDLSILYVVMFLLGILVLVKIGYDVQTKKQWYKKSVLILKNVSKKIKKRRDQQHRIDNLKYLSGHNIPSHTADCNNHEEIFCSISDWNEYNENVKKS